MKYCSNCSAPVQLRVPQGDNVARFVCDACETIHYQNPNIVAGCLPQWQDKLLLCRRAIEPRYGFWTLPAGFMENDETTVEAAARETLEEAGAAVTVSDLFTVFNLPHINQVYMMFRAQLPEPSFAAGTESLEVGLFEEEDIPWDQLAFPVIRETLKCYYQDRSRGTFRIHVADLILVDEKNRRFETRFLNNPG